MSIYITGTDKDVLFKAYVKAFDKRYDISLFIGAEINDQIKIPAVSITSRQGFCIVSVGLYALRNA